MKAKVNYCGLCSVVSIERSENVIASDAELQRYSAQMFLAPPRTIQDGEDTELFGLLQKTVSQGRYNIMVTLSDAGMTPENMPIAVLQEKYRGKQIFATLFDANTADLLSGTKYDGISKLNDGEKDLSSVFHAVELGNAEEKSEVVFDRMKSALLRRIENGTYFVGSIGDKEEEKAAQ